MKIIKLYFFPLFAGLLLLFTNSLVLAAEAKPSLLEDLHNLGENTFLVPYIQKTSTDSEVSVIQNRFFSRGKKQEMLTGLAYSTSGPAYFKTTAVTMLYKVYINSKWSVGLDYSYFSNKLSPAGVQVIKEGESKLKNDPDYAFIPDLDFPKFSYTATASWYPSYGKFNLFNKIMYFDLFLTSGIGQIVLKHKPSALFSFSVGSSFWLTKQWTGRMELQSKLYKETWYNSQHNIVSTQVMLSTGYIF
ncbi:MAG: hypothetical protein HAW63_03345 [Bdellovibrionaceae bacterium]|nr:hypothetical protein [Pseudobdellovibrionaceae bacterium]